MNKVVHSSIIIGCAVIFFTKGFLLIKLEIGQKTPACPRQNSLYLKNDSTCRGLPLSGFRYKKLVILIIDALRYDFALYQDDPGTKLPFHNNMPVFRDLIRDEGCKKARLWRFKADAPTTTMQRLKGLTTGSLPTFIDVSKNFASSEITEDNLLDQFIRSDMNITFMGDDTWMGLFPGRFNKAFPYPSFDVKDLHLVDNGVIEHLLPEIAENDWQVLIAHFLGVDHCGHRYGPYHPEMPLKLQQMNGIVKEVVNDIDDDTLLLVMGDHGMTPTGDHGGETLNEVSATLFAYSPAGAFSGCTDAQSNDREVVNQVDIVPTISLLLGTSIPFANLGIVIKEMIQESDHTDINKNFLGALDINMKQMHTYIKTYQEITKSLPKDLYENFNLEVENLDVMRRSPEPFSVNEIEKKFNDVMHSARNMCQLVWAKFDIGLMVSGLSLLFYWLYIFYNIQTNQCLISLGAVSVLALVLLFLCVLLPNIVILGNETLANFASWTSFIIFTCLVVCFVFRSYSILPDFSLFVSLLLLIFYSVSFTSNSFVLNEDHTVMYIFSSSLALVAFFNFEQYRNISPKDDNSKQVSTYKLHKIAQFCEIVKNSVFHPFSEKASSKIAFCLYLFTALFCARVSFFYRCCRAEQFWCFDDNDTTVSESSPKYFIRTAISCTSLLLCIWTGLRITKMRNNMDSPFSDRILLIASVCCVMHWLIQLIPSETMDALPGWLHILFPRFVYILLGIYLLFLWINPALPVLISDKKVKKTDETNTLQRKTTTKNVVAASGHSFQDTPIVLSLSRLLLCLTVLFSLLLGSQLATAIPLWIVTAFCVLQLVSLKSQQLIGFDTVIVWNLLCSFWWFSTCHQASLSSIRWDAAFVGFQGNHVTNVIPALLLVLDTFSMQILSSVGLPLLMLWKAKGPGFSTLNSTEHFDAAVDDVFLKHHCCHVIKIIGCMLAALMHRRHLMVWWIFAPRFLFELISVVIVIISSLFTHTFVKRLQKKVKIANEYCS